MAKEIRSEREMSEWFLKNYKQLGYSQIIKNNKSRFPDFIMLRGNKQVGVELETLASHFILHKHNLKKVDEIVCLKKDTNFSSKLIELSKLVYKPRIVRISATVDEETMVLLDELMKEGIYRNKSHVIETAIRRFDEVKNDKK